MRGHGEGRVANWIVGLVMAIVIAIGSYLAYTKELPWSSGFEVQATFATGQNVRATTPVRIAGVNVGEVTAVESTAKSEDDGASALITMQLNEDALPLREDSLFKIRPRLFLEGNYFIDVQSGSPSSPAVGDGHSFPVNQTSNTVGLDQVLTTLQTDVRADLQTLLDQFGNALIRYKGAEGFRELYRTSPVANRYNAVVSEALLGTEEGDLSGTLRGLSRILRGLSRNEETLKSFVTNFRVFSGSFAAQDQALSLAIERLPGVLEQADPVLTNLNASFPGLRAFSREALPGVRSSPEALRVATPFIRQIRLLVSRAELRGLVARLRPTVPRLAQLANRNRAFLSQTRALSSCFNEVVVPWSNSTVNPVDPLNVYPHDPTGRTFEESAYGLNGSAGESRSGDANGQTLRVMAGSGANIVRTPGPEGLSDTVIGLTPFPLEGAMPRLGDSAKTKYRPNEPCEEQDPPNLSAGTAPPPADQQPTAMGGIDELSGPGARKLRESAELLNSLEKIDTLPADEADELARAAQRTLNTLGLTGPEVNDYLSGYMRKKGR